MDFKATVKCEKCGGIKFKITKQLSGHDKDLLIQHELLCHDGFGWDISTFELTCVKCGHTSDDNEVEVLP